MQLQHSCSGAAWRRRQQQSGAKPSTTTAQRVLTPLPPAIAQQRHAAIAGPGLLLQHHRRRGPAGRCSSTPADGSGGGDVVRPSAKAAAPPVSAAPLLPDLAGGAASGHHAAGGAASSSSNGAGVSRSSSYSELYKAINSTHYSGAAPLQQQQPDSSSLLPQLQDHAAEPAAAASAAAADAVLLGSTTPSHAAGAASDGVGAATDAAAAGGVPPPPATAAAAADAAGVEDAIRKAQQALAAAESSLSSIHKLRSAQPPNKWAGALAALRSVASAVGVGAFLVASHAFGLGWQWAGATIGALALAALAIKQQTITEAGAVAAAAASLATLGCSLRFGMVLLVVSYSSFKLRQFKEARAPDLSTMLSRVATAGQQQQQAQVQQVTRDWLEIACIAAVPTMLAIAYGAMAGCLDLPLGSLLNVETWRADLLTLLQGAVLGWYACVCGDAWSSELGALSADQPRLLTTLAPVRRGTHGGVTLLGLSGAAAGGLLAGLVFYCAAVLSPTLWVFEAQRAAAMAQWRVIPLGLMAGLFGSLLDSLLGATLQFTGYDPATSSLTNRPAPKVQRISGLAGCTRWLTGNVVDVLAASVTAALTALAALATFA